VQMVQKNQRIKKKDTYKKKKGIRKYLSRSIVHLVFDSGACVIRREEQLKGRIISKNIARGNIWNMSIYFLEPIPEKFSYSLGGYSHRERCRAPNRKKSIKGRREVEADDKEQVDAHKV
jgi:hypothetical protein